MSWRDVRSLKDAGMDVASHSHAHRVLTTLSPEQALSDLRTSRKKLDEVLGQDVRTVAYPVGYKLKGPFLKAAEEAGFDVGFTNAAGLCLLGRDERLNVPRISVSQEDIGALYKWLLLVGQRPPRAGRFGFSGKMSS
jgi:peptidoglycan/xylan/chitin deacetylase (PgdA/CDA1 family)